MRDAGLRLDFSLSLLLPFREAGTVLPETRPNSYIMKEMNEKAFRRALPVDDTPGCEPAATVLQARADATPTSDLLPRIVERRPTRRRRRVPASEGPTVKARPPVHPSGFPVPEIRALADDAKEEVPAGGRADVASAASSAAVAVENTGEKPFWMQDTGPGDFSSSPTDEGSDFPDNDRILAAMSSEEIRKSVADIYAHMKPESIEALRKRGAEKMRSSRAPPRVSSEAHPVGPAQSEEPPSLSKKGSRVSFGGETMHYPSADLQPVNDNDAEDGGPTALLSHGKNAFVGNEDLVRRVADVVSLDNVARAETVEQDKLAWTTSADEPLPTGAVVSKELDEAVKRSVEALGGVARWRFDLHGTRLSEGQMRTLPTHRGLHHHGVEPDIAGYTLGDLLLLARSSFVGQRAIAMNVLAGAIRKYGGDIMEPLGRAGGLATMMAESEPAKATSSAAHSSGMHNLSLSRAYLELVSALVTFESRQGASHEYLVDSAAVSVEQLYFVSSMYVQPRPEGDGDAINDRVGSKQSPVMKALCTRHCPVRLVLISCAALSIGDFGIAVQALEICYFIVRSSSLSAIAVAEDRMAVRDLHEIALTAGMSTSTEHGGLQAGPSVLSRMLQLAYDTIAVCTVAVGWEGRSDLLSRPGGLVSSAQLEKAGRLLGSASRPGSSAAVTSHCIAYCVLRLFRSALAFGLGQDMFGELVVRELPILLGLAMANCPDAVEPRPVEGPADPSVTIFLRKAVAEAYLALETYAHGLFSGMVAAEERVSEAEKSEGKGQDVVGLSEQQAQLRAQIESSKSRLLMLLPVAVEAATLFVGSEGESFVVPCSKTHQMNLCARAAAGHFVATVLAMTSGAHVFLSHAVISRVTSLGERTTSTSADALRGSTPKDATTFLSLALLCSMSHAAARIVSSAVVVGAVRLPSSAHTHISSVVDALHRTSGVQHTREICYFVACNTYAEWLGLVSTHHPSVETARSALRLLTKLTDCQVGADLIRRCILNERVLRTLRRNFPEYGIASLVEATLTRVLSELLSLTTVSKAKASKESSVSSQEFSMRLPLSSPRDFYAFLVGQPPGEIERYAGVSVVRVLRDAGVADPVDVYQALLLGVPPAEWFNSHCVSLRPGWVSFASELIVSGDAISQSEHLLPSGLESAVSGISTSASSVIAIRLLALAELLVDHGPPVDADGGPAAIACAILSAMLRPSDADESLRRALWTRVVSDCAGVGLFEHAHVLGKPRALATDALAGEYFHLLSRGRVGTMVQCVWSAAKPALLGGGYVTRGLLGSVNGRSIVRSWVSSGGAGEDSQRVEEICLSSEIA